MAVNAHVSTNQTTHTVSDYLKQPTLIEKTLTVVSERKFISESLFTPGFNADGGAVAYQESVNKYMDEGAVGLSEDFAIAEGSEYPQVYMSDVGPQIQKTKKYAIESWITFEDEDRNQLGVLARATTRMMNTMVKQLDTVTMNMLLTNSKIRDYTAAGAWATTTYAYIFDDLLEAKGMVEDEQTAGGEYIADTLVVSNNTFTKMLRNNGIRELYKEVDQAAQSPYFTGTMGSLAGLTILKTPYMTDDYAFVLKKGEIGGIADEVPLTMKPPFRDESVDKTFLRAKRLTVAFLTDPGAIVRVDITP